MKKHYLLSAAISVACPFIGLVTGIYASIKRGVPFVTERERRRVLNRLLQLGLILLFIMAMAIRVYDLDAPGILPEREFRSMLLARVNYYEQAESIADWQKEITLASLQKLDLLEPPILETIIAQLYIITGGEYIQIARILSSVFWLIGGIFLFKIARKIMTPTAAFIAIGYYLFVPLGVLTSRSFQPDSLMIMLFLGSLAAILWHAEQPTRWRLIVAASVSSLTLLVKPLPLFTIFGAFVGLTVFRRGWRRVIDRPFLTFTLISLTPTCLYYGYGLFGEGFLGNQAEMSFRPYLLLHREFWEGWIIVADEAVGHAALLSGLLGWALLNNKLERALLSGLWLGYAIFGLVFTHHIHTHNYYHLQLIVIIALSFGSLFDRIANHLSSMPVSWFRLISVAAILLIIIFFDVRDIRAGLRAPMFEQAELAQEISQLVNHSSRLVLVARHYGISLEYYGQLSGTPWPKSVEYWLYRRPDERELSIQERLDNLGFEPEYFVITDFSGFENRHADLKEYLHKYCSVYSQTDQYLIYDGNCT